jgi:hypothetical protein
MKQHLTDLFHAAVIAALIGAPFALYFAFVMEA